MAGPSEQQEDNPLHLHIDCLQGISARSFLDGLRVLARTSGDIHSKAAFEIDPMSAMIWSEHIPDQDRTVLQDGSRIVNQESPVQSWETFRKAIRRVPGEVSQHVAYQLKDVLDAIEVYYDREVMKSGPLYPSVVWHMMAVILLLDRLRVRTLTCTEVPRGEGAPRVLSEILKGYPQAKSEGENPAITTFDGAILLKVLKPASPFAPERVFHGKAIGRDCQTGIETVLGLTYQSPQVNGSKGGPPGAVSGQEQAQPRNIAYHAEQPPGSTRHVQTEQPQQRPSTPRSGDDGTPPRRNGGAQDAAATRQLQDPQQTRAAVVPPPLPPSADRFKDPAGAPPRQEDAPGSEEFTTRQKTERPRRREDQPSPQQAAPRQAVVQQADDEAVSQGTPPPAEEEDTGALDSPLWNVEKDLTLLQANIDDMTPEHLSFCAELLRQQEASDVWLTPIVMKKNRAAQEINILANDDKVETLLITLFRQTTTLGVRVWTSKAGLQRVTLRREMISVEYCRRSVQVKVAYLGKEPISIKPEYEQCMKVAMDTEIPLMVVTEEVKALAKDHERRKLLAMI